MLGRELKLPIDLLFGRPEEEPVQAAVEYTRTLQERMERVHQFARTQSQEMSSKMKERYDTLLECSSMKLEMQHGCTILSAGKDYPQSNSGPGKALIRLSRRLTIQSIESSSDQSRNQKLCTTIDCGDTVGLTHQL